MAETPMETTFLLVRHAQTHWNALGRIQGHRDTPLTPEGMRQAESWGRRLADFDVARILASDLGRAYRTAQGINRTLKRPIHTEKGLREQDWGEWAGLTMARIRSTHPGVLAAERKDPWAFCPPGGEDRLNMVARACRCLEAAAERWPGERILVVTHEGVIKGLIYFLASSRAGGARFVTVRPHHLHVVTGTAKGLRISAVNRLGLETDG